MTCNFLKIIVRNVAKDIYRRRIYLNNKEDAIEELEDMPCNHINEVSELIIDRESVERIANEIQRLPDIYRDVLLLEKVYGYTREETMTILDASYETLKKRMTRAKIKLLDALRKEGLNNGRENIGKNAR